MTRILSKNYKHQGEEGKRGKTEKGAQKNSFEAFHKTYQENTTQTDRRT